MKKQKSTQGVAEQDLEKQALSRLNAAHYKDAIRLFKKLLQTGNKQEWKQKLAYCYVQRSIQFATKGMFKEAMVLWENHIPFAEAPYDANDQYIFWLIQTNNQAKIQSNLSGLSAHQLDKQYPALASVLGFLMLCEHSEFEQSLPQDSIFIAHFNIVKTALQAYQDNDNDKLVESLKLLPYRSAFRDFRTLLNAAMLIPDAVEPGKVMLAKIPANSAYFQSVRTLLACTKEGAELTAELMQLSQQQCAVISELKGLSKKQLDIIQQYSREQNKLTDKVQFKLAIQYQGLLGAEFVEHFCQNLLASYPAGKKEFNKHFKHFSEFEEYRIKALKCEEDNNLQAAEHHWRHCLKILDTKETDNNLRAALILRRVATREPDGEERTNILIESLGYDASDRDSYLHITQYYGRQEETAKEYNTWLERTLKQFPQDIEVLTHAVNTATRNKSYTKANQYASKILKIDPINTFAKQALFSSYLSKARQLISKKSYYAVEKEISQAEKLNLGKTYYKQTQLVLALLSFASEDKKQGLQRIVEQLAGQHKDPVNCHFNATMEALLTSLPVTTILRELPPIKKHLLSVQELNALSQQIEQYAKDDDNRAYIHKALEKIKAAFKRSLSEQEYTEELLTRLCKALDSIGHFELLRHCLKSIPQSWVKPIWMYYQIYADTSGNAAKCSKKQLQQLQVAAGKAREEKDHQAAILLEQYLDRYYAAHPPQGFGFFNSLFGGFDDDDDDEDDEDDDEYYDPMDELFGHLDESEGMKLNKKVKSIMKKFTPEKLIHSLMQQAGNHERVVLAVMQDPEILTALMMIKAAEELKMDIDVDIDDVIDAFEIDDDNGSSFPFPF